MPLSKHWIVWDKQTDGNHFADCEIAWTNLTGRTIMFRHMWNGMIKASEHRQKRVHPTQKPIALFTWAMEKYLEDGGLIFDPFLGSGISVIGAESLGEDFRVIGCELSPNYIAVTIHRWQEFTGQKAILK